jgi:hypothetical protein
MPFAPAIILVMLVIFIMLARFSSLHIDPAVSLHVVRATTVLVDVHIRRRRLEVAETETQVGSTDLQRNLSFCPWYAE